MPATSILHFRDIDDFHRAVGFPRRSALPDYDLLRFEDARQVSVPFMPPFRKDWYQLVLKQNPGKAVLLNSERLTPTQSVVLFTSPNHVYSWQLDRNLRGFVLFFKPDFLAAVPDVEREFPFFELTAPNLIVVKPDELAEFDGHLTQMHTVSEGSHAYRRQMLQALLLAFLYRCKSAYQVQEPAGQSRQRTLVGKFQRLVNAGYLEKRTVGAYAEALDLTPNHLNEIIKETTGKTARQFIVERMLTEAKNLLCHTDLDVSVIAHSLQFDEPTNFSKFFRRYAGLTPGQFRQRNGTQSS